MTYLELCQALQREAVFPGNDISDVTGQTGEYLKMTRWVERAWTEIQLERPWDFRWVPFSVSLTSGSRVYDVRSEIGADADDATFTTQPLVLTHPTSGQKKRLELLTYRLFLGYWADKDQTGQSGCPSQASVRPDGQVEFNTALDEDYALSGAYLRAPQVLAANDDEPIMPSAFHQAILYRALKKYAEFEEAGALYQTASYNDSMWSDRMHRELLPKVMLGHTALA